MGMYPEKPRRDRSDWSEWILDECGLERDTRLVIRLALALNGLQEALIDPIKAWERKERQTYPKKPQPTTLEEWAEWLLDECGVEHDDQLVRRMAIALFEFQEITCKHGCYWPLKPRDESGWEYIIELWGAKKEKPKPN